MVLEQKDNNVGNEQIDQDASPTFVNVLGTSVLAGGSVPAISFRQ